MVADISTGAMRVKLDEFVIKAAVLDMHWESEGASSASDRYELRVSGGAVQVSLDTSASKVERVDASPAVELQASGELESALDILLDGVESRVKSGR